MANPSPAAYYAKCPSKNLLDSLNNRQSGISNESRFRSDFLKLKLRQLRCKKMTVAKFLDLHVDMGNSDYDFACSFVSPIEESYACSWVTGDYSGQYVIVGVFSRNPRQEIAWIKPPSLGYAIYCQEVRYMEVYKNRDLVDFIHLKNNSYHVDAVMMVTQRTDERATCFQMVPKTYEYTQPLHSLHRCSLEIDYIAYSTVWSPNTQRLSLGLDSGIVFATLYSFFGDYFDTLCPGGNRDRFALPYVHQFNSTGNLLHFGFSDGHVACLDVRSPWKNFQTDVVVNHDVTSIRLLEDDVTMIVGSSTDKLRCFDKRMNSVLFDYSGRSTIQTKIGFDLDESFGVICASSSDFVTRYWDLKYGHLLAELPETSVSKNKMFIYSNIQSSGTKLYSYTFNGDKILYKEAFPDT